MFKKQIKKSTFLFQILSQMAFSLYQYEIFSIFEFESQQFNTQKILHIEIKIDSQICFMMNVVREKKTFQILYIIKINMFIVLIYREKNADELKIKFLTLF